MAVQDSNRKRVVIAGSVVVAAAMVAFLQRYPQYPTYSTGTIGTAQRYNSTPNTGTELDVDQDALATWAQSETFDRILKDPQARRLFSDAALVQSLADAAAKTPAGEFPKGSAALAALSNPAVHDALNNPAFVEALSNAVVREGLVNQAQKADAKNQPG